MLPTCYYTHLLGRDTFNTFHQNNHPLRNHLVLHGDLHLLQPYNLRKSTRLNASICWLADHFCSLDSPTFFARALSECVILVLPQTTGLLILKKLMQKRQCPSVLASWCTFIGYSTIWGVWVPNFWNIYIIYLKCHLSSTSLSNLRALAPK